MKPSWTSLLEPLDHFGSPWLTMDAFGLALGILGLHLGPILYVLGAPWAHLGDSWVHFRKPWALNIHPKWFRIAIGGHSENNRKL